MLMKNNTDMIMRSLIYHAMPLSTETRIYDHATARLGESVEELFIKRMSDQEVCQVEIWMNGLSV